MKCEAEIIQQQWTSVKKPPQTKHMTEYIAIQTCEAAGPYKPFWDL